jgi:hypothetical protein
MLNAAGVWLCAVDQVQVQALRCHYHQAHQPPRMGLRLGVCQVRLLPGALKHPYRWCFLSAGAARVLCLV